MSVIDVDAEINGVRLITQGSDPSTPSSGHDIIYSKSGGLFIKTAGGVVSGPFAAAGTLLHPHNMDGRLTLTSGTPVTTADVTAATTLYYTPYVGDRAVLYNGSSWDELALSEISITLASLTASLPYDVWVYNNAGAPALELLAWTNATTRATALAYQNGVLVKSGAATRRYVGTICITSTTGQCEDSITNRLVWNYYHRISRVLYKYSASSHTYTTASWQAWNNSTANRVAWVCGLVEDPIEVKLAAEIAGSAGNILGQVSIGWDSATAEWDQVTRISNANQYLVRGSSSWCHLGSIGYHYYQALEYGATTSTFAYFALQATEWG